jgi:hypothetical protein
MYYFTGQVAEGRKATSIEESTPQPQDSVLSYQNLQTSNMPYITFINSIIIPYPHSKICLPSSPKVYNFPTPNPCTNPS